MKKSNFWKWAERALLVCVLALQVVILVKGRGGSEADTFAGDDSQGYSPRPAPLSGGDSPASFANSSNPSVNLPRSMSESGLIYSSGNMDPERLYSRMNLVFERTVRELDKGWDSLVSSPAMDMRIREKDYLITACVPGVDPSQVDVFLEGRLLTIVVPVGNVVSGRYRLFQRRFQLPGFVGPSESATAVLSNGILRIVVPKSEEPLRASTRVVAYRLM